MMYGDGFVERYNRGGKGDPFQWKVSKSISSHEQDHRMSVLQ